MKKIKILFCGLIIGLSVWGYIGSYKIDSAKELLLLNVEALSFDESLTPNCVFMIGTCFNNEGDIVRGMVFKR